MTRLAKWADTLSLLFSAAVIGLAVLWTVRSGVFAVPLTDSPDLPAYLLRSSGMTAYGLMVASIVWGLLMSTRLINNWSPGVLSMTIHTSLSWFAIALSFLHALLLLNRYFDYQATTILIPLVGPQPLRMTLGISGLWLSVAVAVSFALRNRIGMRAWRWLHQASFLAYALVTVHVLLAGTDSGLSSFRLMLGLSVCAVVALLALRLSRKLVTLNNDAAATIEVNDELDETNDW
ncbi:MAG: hypothetical protein R3E39_09450 [Anaerolineae bacterium]